MNFVNFQQLTANTQQMQREALHARLRRARVVSWSLVVGSCHAAALPRRGMTLIETLVAISILAVAIVAPMSLTMQSLSAAYYARDQIAAFNLAQEAIESVRSVRDGNILRIALSDPDPTCTPTNLLCGIPINTDFTIDTRNNAISICDGTCPSLRTDGDLYGYEPSWIATRFIRTIRVAYVGQGTDEIRITVTVKQEEGARQPPPFTIEENLYRWVEDGSGA